MKRITEKDLQGEFGVTFVEATLLIDRHRSAATKRYRTLQWIIVAALLAMLVATFMDFDHWLWLQVAVLAPMIVYQVFVERSMREGLLAEARATTARRPA